MKVKVGLIGLFDMLKFKNLGKKRQIAISNSETTSLPASYKVNELANIYHPYKQYLIIKEIIEETDDVKSFILVPDNNKTKELAPFKAGSYLSIYVNLDDNYVSRSYSISSSPKEALEESFYRITIKRVKDGVLSNYMLDHAEVGMRVVAGEPSGFLTLNKLRDPHNLVAVAGGVGITPFISMAKAIYEGTEDYNLTILYGIKSPEDIIFKRELADLEKKCDKIKVVYVYSETKVEGEEFGFISVDLIKKYAKDEYAVYATGPRGLLDYLAKELPKLKLGPKYLRLEQSPLPAIKTDTNTYNIKVINKDEIYMIRAKGDETILQAFERNNITIRAKCHLGGCGFCRSRLISGTYEATKFEKLNEVDKQYNYIHPCCSYPRSDMEIEIFEY